MTIHTKKISAGNYVAAINGTVYEIVKRPSPIGSTLEWWAWNQLGKACFNAFASKKEALDSLEDFILTARNDSGRVFA